MVGKYFIQQSIDVTSSFEVVYALEENDSYLAFSKDVSDSTVNVFQRELDALKQDDGSGTSTYDRIVTQYIPSLVSANPNQLSQRMTASKINRKPTEQAIGRKSGKP